MIGDRFAVFRELLGQALVARYVAYHLDSSPDAVKQVAASLVAVEHLLDCPGQVELGVAQLNVQRVVGAGLDLDEVAEAQDFVAVAVLHQNIEVGIDQGSLVAVGDLERHRSNTVFLVGLLLQLGVFRGVDDLDAHLSLAGDLVLLQQGAELRHQRRQQGMGFGAEVTPQQKGLLQPRQIAVGGVGDGIESPLRDIGAQRGHLAEPEIGDQGVGDNEGADLSPATMPASAAGERPALPLQVVDIETEKYHDQAQVIDQVPQVDDATGDGVESRASAQAA